MAEKKRFYHFMGAERALQAIERRRLKISNLADTNDPYECLSFCLRNQEQEREVLSFQNIQETQRQIYHPHRIEKVGLFGIICFSELSNNPLLWGHYADKCKGVCLGFDIEVHDDGDKDFIKPVTYIPKRYDIDDFKDLIQNYFINRDILDESTELGQRSAEQIKALYFTKSYHWEYEKEWRALALGQLDPVSGLYFDSFGDRMILREISVGFRCSIEDIKFRLDKLVARYSDPPKIFSTQRSLSGFAIEQTPFQ